MDTPSQSTSSSEQAQSNQTFTNLNSRLRYDPSWTAAAPQDQGAHKADLEALLKTVDTAVASQETTLTATNE
jgi:hypothetical protein